MNPRGPIMAGQDTASARLEPPQSAHRADLIAAGLATLAVVHVVLTRLSWADIPLQTDTGMWAYIGSRILDGARLYRDLWESKPPGIYYTFAVVERLFGRAAVPALLWMDAVLSLAVMGLTYRLARRFASRVAAAGAVCLLSIVFCHRVLADWGDNVEKFTALFEMTACLLLLDGARRRGSMRRFLAAGICCGLAALFRQTGAVFLLAATMALLWGRLQFRAWPGVWRSAIAWLWIGAAVVWIPILVWMKSISIFDPFWEQVVRFDLLRMATGEQSRLLRPEHWLRVAEGLKLVVVLFGPALVATFWWSSPLIRSAKRMNGLGAPPPLGVGNGSRDRSIMSATSSVQGGRLDVSDTEKGFDISRFVIIWYWGLATLPFLIAPYGFGHYLLQAAPVAAVMAAWLFDGVFAGRWPATDPTATGRRWATSKLVRSVTTVLTVASLLLGAVSLVDHFVFTFDRRSRFRRSYAVRAERTAALVDAVDRATRPDQGVMMWPPDAAVSFYARRRTPLEYSNADVIFKGWLPRLSPPMSELLEHLRANRPDVIVDSTRIKVQGPSLPTYGRSPSPTPGGDGAPVPTLRGNVTPMLLTSAEGYSLLEPPNYEHPHPVGRALAPLKRWIRANYGGQRREGPAVFFFYGKPWRRWEAVLLSRNESSN